MLASMTRLVAITWQHRQLFRDASQWLVWPGLNSTSSYWKLCLCIMLISISDDPDEGMSS